MKQGIFKGYNAGCCDGLEIWGASCHAPDYSGNKILDILHHFNNNGLSYDLFRETEATPLSINSDIKPEFWPRAQGRNWDLFAAKVPGTYNPSPGIIRPISSSSLGNGTWEANLGIMFEHVVRSFAPNFKPDDGISHDSKMCYGSRAIYVDGQQKYVTYRTTTRETANDDFGGPLFQRRTWGDHHQIIINSAFITDPPNPQGVTYYAVGTLDGKGNEGDPLDPNEYPKAPQGTSMEKDFMRYHNNVYNVLLGLSPIVQGPCNQLGCGKDYFILSSYRPSTTLWNVARVKYEGLQVFCNKAAIPNGDPEGNYVGNYWIVLPSCRVYLDSSVSGSDECWVCAIHRTAKKIVTGQWLSNVFAPGGSNFADGTLSNNEVANIILDSNNGELNSRYPGELWNNLRILSYNRVYDPGTKHSRDLLLFVTYDQPTFASELDVVADFEQPGGYDRNYLDNGLVAAEIGFETHGTASPGSWISSPFDSYAGSYSAQAEAQDVTAENEISLVLAFNLVNEGDITFQYRHDNRSYGLRLTGSDTWPSFPVLANFAEPDNSLNVYLDGALMSGNTLVGEDEVPQFKIDNIPQNTSVIDNAFVPGALLEEPQFLQWRKVKIHMLPGEHTLRITQVRKWQDNGHMRSQVDQLSLGEIMVGEDTTGKKRWLYNGQKVQKVETWAWPQRDDESATSLSGRVSTMPDFITLDKKGRILYGGPHYVVRLIPKPSDPTLFILDQEFGKSNGNNPGSGQGGVVKFSATPVAPTSETAGTNPTCPEDFDPNRNLGDTIADPPWGSFQILPTGDDDAFQVRGANASIRDASDTIFDPQVFTYRTEEGGTNPEFFYNQLSLRNNQMPWTHRPHSWTITNHGKHLRPHVEVIWRPTRYSYPYPPGPWPNPPYKTGFAESTSSQDLLDNMRPRNLLKIIGSSVTAVWSGGNVVIPATFSDALLQEPQTVWIRPLNNDPNNGPDYDPIFHNPDKLDQTWPSGRWQRISTRYIPTGYVGLKWTGPYSDYIYRVFNCFEGDFEEPPSLVVFGFILESPRNLFTDFDAVDEQGVCCD